MYTVYALYSKLHDKIYTGYTSDLHQRLISHNHPKNKGWTSKYKPWILIYREEFDCKKDAMQREKQLKGYKGRQFIWELIRKLLESGS